MIYTITETGKKRLEKLRDYIDNKVSDESFNFESWRSNDDAKCALGYIHKVFPKSWFNDGDTPFRGNSYTSHYTTKCNAMDWFGIDINVMYILFMFDSATKASGERHVINGTRLRQLPRSASRKKWLERCDLILSLLVVE